MQKNWQGLFHIIIIYPIYSFLQIIPLLLKLHFMCMHMDMYLGEIWNTKGYGVWKKVDFICVCANVCIYFSFNIENCSLLDFYFAFTFE
jgi:hypothetical protein